MTLFSSVENMIHSLTLTALALLISNQPNNEDPFRNCAPFVICCFEIFSYIFSSPFNATKSIYLSCCCDRWQFFWKASSKLDFKKLNRWWYTVDGYGYVLSKQIRSSSHAIQNKSVKPMAFNPIFILVFWWFFQILRLTRNIELFLQLHQLAAFF